MVTIPVSCGTVREKENKLTLISKMLPFRLPFITGFNAGNKKKKTESHQYLLYHKKAKKKDSTSYIYSSLKHNSGRSYTSCGLKSFPVIDIHRLIGSSHIQTISRTISVMVIYMNILCVSSQVHRGSNEANKLWECLWMCVNRVLMSEQKSLLTEGQMLKINKRK